MRPFAATSPSGRTLLSFLRVLVLVAPLAACSYVPSIVTPYRIDVQQGNVVSQEMVAQLKPGLTRDQVRFVLGTPLLTDIFHKDRWDYVYRLQKGKTGEVEQRRLSVFFGGDDKLVRVDGDVAAATSTPDAQPEASPRARVIDLGSLPEGATLPPPEEKGFFGRMLEKVGL